MTPSRPCLSIYPVRTQIFQAHQALADFIVRQVPETLVQERMILAVTSKIVSLAEGRLVPKDEITKEALIRREADHYLGAAAQGCHLTIKEGLLIPSAGIDESNSQDGHYILYPSDPFASCRVLHQDLKARWGLKSLGILMTDSHTSPLRRGVTGISLAHWGFQGLSDLIGSEDLFGRKLKMTTINQADALATAATVMMGEGSECQPLAIVHGAQVEFRDETDPNELKMPLSEDIYLPLLGAHLKF